jgi:hypothetical protein
MTKRLEARGAQRAQRGAGTSALLLLAALVASGAGCGDLDAVQCQLGAVGCPCLPSDRCEAVDGGETSCREGICSFEADEPALAAACPVGTRDCPCNADGACGARLSCTDVGTGEPTCQPAALCPAGSLGCACYDNESCDAVADGEVGLRCDADVCVRADCERGQAGCRCDSSGECGAGDVCVGGLCEVDTGQTLAVPEDLRCYTACQGDLVLDGNRLVKCDADGMMQRCFGDTVCVLGTCVVPEPGASGEELLTECRTSAHCPEHQACIAGHCYSDCVSDADCRGGRRCSDKVCRLPCETSSENGDSCGVGQHCKAKRNDSQQGFCQTLGTPVFGRDPNDPSAQVELESSIPTAFSATPRSLAFSVSKAGGEIEITNDSDQPDTFVIRKLEHTELTDGGQQTITDGALPWLELGLNGETPELADELSIDLAPGQSATLVIANADNPDAAADDPAYSRWEGKLVIEPDHGGPLELSLAFTRKPEGQWVGSAFFLASFGDAGLEQWLAASDKSDQAAVQQVGNALIRRWVALRKGAISLQEFLAALSAVRNAAWKEPTVAARCPSEDAPDPNVGCYPSLTASGISIFSDSLQAAPVPSGVSELPFAMNIQPSAGSATAWSGRIVSDIALQYDGDPALSLTFADDPEECSVRTGNACLTFIEDMSADIWVGGRYATSANDVFCADAGDTFERHGAPWLLPGLLAGTEIDPATGERLRYECRDTWIPFGDDSSVAALNKNRAASNPIPDGQPRQRHLRLLDGALINQDTIFVLFEERFASFLDPSDDEGFAAYGYMVLSRAAQLPDDEEYEGSVVRDDRDVPEQLSLSCDPELVAEVLAGEPTTTLAASNAGRVGRALITGFVPPSNLRAPIAANEVPHYLCASTGRFDDVCNDAEVLFFTLKGPSNTVADLRGNVCNQFLCVDDGSCEDGRCQPDADCGGCAVGAVCRPGRCEGTLLDFVASSAYEVRLNPVYGCPDDAAQCASTPNDWLQGRTFYTTTEVAELGPSSPEAVHYLCLETGKIDSECPHGSDVRYFTLPRAQDPSTLACQTTQGMCNEGELCSLDFEKLADDCADGTSLVNGRPTPCTGLFQQRCRVGEPCAAKGTCTVQSLQNHYGSNMRMDPVFRCTDPDQVFCSSDRTDLRNAKVFFSAASSNTVFASIDEEIERAFQYKTRFRTRAGLNIGFAPDVCIPGSVSTPYCYEPATIESLRDRVDCVTDIYLNQYASLSAGDRGLLKGFLERTFSLSLERDPTLPTPIVHDGFERLHAELMVMLGDESLTRALGSRFDLAGVQQASFPGAAFEPNGINLSGGAGYEMFSFYQAVQYYQVALDRFFNQGPSIWKSLNPALGIPEGEGFVTQATVTSYFTRLVTASAKKAQAQGEIAKRYQFFNRPDLARLVIRRAFTAAYLESVTFARMMRKIIEISSAEDQAQIERELDLAQRRYTSALRTMRQVFLEISDDETFFGIPLSFVPFPPLDMGDVNAFEKRLELAQQKLEAAAEAEAAALDQRRTFDTDRALFQSALSDLRLGFEGQLADICGFFTGTDGQVYPAIAAYKDLNERARAFVNPCGYMGNGQLFDALIDLEQAATDVDILKADYAHLLKGIQNLSDRVTAQCDRIEDFSEWRVQKGETVIGLNGLISGLNILVATTDRIVQDLGQIAALASCTPIGPFSAGNCVTSTVANVGFMASAIGVRVGQAVALGAVAGAEAGIRHIELDITEREILEECDAAQIDTNYEIQEHLNQIPAMELRALQLQRELERKKGAIEALYNLALADEAARDEQLANLISVEAARNDPNVRIYRNDAVINADRKFYAALQEAFRLTRIFEYLTGQSYAPREDLLLIRLVQYGQPNLDSYLAELADAFDQFELQFGNPEVRLEILSLRDDILNIPYTDESGEALTEDARLALLRDALAAPGLKDPRGYITIPFATDLNRVSPLTSLHKIRAIEAEIVAQEPGDELGRVYLRARGTGVVRNTKKELVFTTFPERLAVLNTFFNGERLFGYIGNGDIPSLYLNLSMRDRPLLNTGWDLVINQRDEHVNEDIRLDGLSDIRLYFYYTDFTAL